jgi:hypothetical protein
MEIKKALKKRIREAFEGSDYIVKVHVSKFGYSYTDIEKPGKRWYNFNKTVGLIRDEEIRLFDSPYREDVLSLLKKSSELEDLTVILV